MGLFDFLRRRRPDREETQPRQKRGILSRIKSWIFGEETMEPEEPQPVPPPDEPDDGVVPPDIPEGVTIVDNPEDLPAGYTWKTDQELLDQYSGMLQTMQDKGWIREFASDEDAAEFLRILSSDAWRDGKKFWDPSSGEALAEAQAAIERGATAGALQDDYNAMIEKKSNAYLELWDDFVNRDAETWQKIFNEKHQTGGNSEDFDVVDFINFWK